ncbi:hypothetical protein FVO58_01095 [Metabacillus halosaccharovorans]|nr:hypothetical protein [Metabacillus halosaccharovorans]
MFQIDVIKGFQHSYLNGAYLKVRFTGTSVKIKLEKTVTLLVNIEGTTDRVFKDVNETVS